jgi:hypothetical protein
VRLGHRLIVMALALIPAQVAAQDEGSGTPVVSVRITPSHAIEPGMATTIDGVAPLDSKGVVALRITKPDGKVVPLEVPPRRMAITASVSLAPAKAMAGAWAIRPVCPMRRASRSRSAATAFCMTRIWCRSAPIATTLKRMPKRTIPAPRHWAHPRPYCRSCNQPEPAVLRWSATTPS